MRSYVIHISLTLLLTLTAFTSMPATAKSFDERIFVGKWVGETDGDVFYLTINADGTGDEHWPDYPDYDWTFTWELQDGKYHMAEDGGYDGWYYDYEFSSMYSVLTLDEEYGDHSLTLERDSSLITDLCCSSCCGVIFLPFAIVFPMVIIFRRRR